MKRHLPGLKMKFVKFPLLVKWVKEKYAEAECEICIVFPLLVKWAEETFAEAESEICMVSSFS